MYPRRLPKGYHRLSAVKIGFIKRSAEKQRFKGMERHVLFRERPTKRRFNYFEFNYASQFGFPREKRTVKNIHTLSVKAH